MVRRVNAVGMGNRGLRYTYVLWTAAAAAAGFACGSDHTRTSTTSGQELTTCVSLDASGDSSISLLRLFSNFGNDPVLRVGALQESLLRFDLSRIPDGAAIDRAALQLYVSSTRSDLAPQVNAHRVTASWNEGSVTFASFLQRFDLKPIASFRATSGNIQKSLDLTDQTRRWFSGAQSNNGLLLESLSLWQTVFVSSEGGTPEQRPHLEVCYTVPDQDHCSPDPCENGGTCENNSNSYTCQCQPGFTGDRCETQIDNCAAAPCQNGGVCTNGVNSYTCQCAPGYTGTNCESVIDHCAGSPCQNGGVCSNSVDGYTCGCPLGYTGTNCETNINDCADNPCQNGGTCNDGVGGYTCECPTGFTGTHCEENIDDCANNPCHNGGTCIDGVSSYTCTCAPDWSGPNCDDNINACDQHPCLNGGECSDGTGLDAYTCACPAGYTGDNCQIDINDCANSPCQNGGLCVDGVNSYTCQCAPGYTGANCETFGCETAYDNTPCDDHDACTTRDTCQSGRCTGADPVQCPGSTDQCHLDGVCDPATGTCSNPAKADGTSCSDSNACTDGDVCLEGSCAAGAPTQCDGTCEPATGACIPDGPVIVIGDVYVGTNLQAPGAVNLASAAGVNGLTVTVTSTDPTRVLLSTDPNTVGTASVNLPFAPGAVSSETPLYVQALGTGSVALTATARRSPSAAASAVVVPSGFMFETGSFTTTTQSPNTSVTVAAVALDPATRAHIADQAVRAGFAVDVALANSNGGMGSLTVNPVRFVGGMMTASTEFDPAEVGSTALSVVMPAGFDRPADSADIAVTITGPILTVGDPGPIGKDLESSFRIDLAALAGPNGQPITILSADPTLALLSSSPTGPGTTSLTTIVPGGAITSSPIFVQALAGSGQVGLTITSPGYTPQNKFVTFTRSGFVLLQSDFATTIASGNTALTIVSAQFDDRSVRQSIQPLRPGAAATVPLTSTSGTIGRITPSVSFAGGDSTKTATFTPLAVGSTSVVVGVPNGFNEPGAGGSLRVTVTDPALQVTLGDNLIGKDLEVPANIVLLNNATPPPGGLLVTVTGSPPEIGRASCRERV